MKIVVRITLLFYILLSGYITVYTQTKHGNEWINPAKKYLKLKVAENGIYKVTYEELAAAGFLTSKIEGTSLQLFNYGNEHAIHVNNNDFGPGAHFEFYGEKNTIGLDSLLYKDWQKDLLNPDYSLVNDTNAYFLTLSPESSNKRYILKNPNYSNTSLTPFTYYLHQEKLIFSSHYFKNVDSGDVRYSQLESSEGFNAGINQITTVSLPATNIVSTGPQPKLAFRTGLNGNFAKLEITWNGQIKETLTSAPRKTLQFNYTLEMNELTPNNALIIKNIQSTVDRHLLANAALIYPRAFDFGNKSAFNFSMSEQSSPRLIEISNFNTANSETFLYDPKNNIRYSTRQLGNKTQAIIDGSSTITAYIIANVKDGLKTVPSMVTFQPLRWENEGQQYIIISNKALYATGPNYLKDYADYRNSSAGGGYKTAIVDVQDLYDHFGYGIDRHFLGVKHFAGYMKAKWLEAKFVFLVGKGIEYPYIRTANDVINYRDKVFFVPTYGYIGSDNMLFSEGNFPDPYFAVGRLAARSADDIKNYLEKVKQHDQAPFIQPTLEDKSWMKKVLHLGGGKNDSEQKDIKNGLDNIATVLQDTIYGADVRSFFKKSSDAIQFNINEEINDLFDNGVRIVNFFGHSSAGSWDFSIENPRNFNNFGKYPFINSFGCYSGNLHGPTRGISESFVLEKDRGSITFFASTGTAFINSLSSYGYRMYKTQVNEFRNKSIGETIQQLAKDNRNATGAELTLYSQLTLHGDPALNLYLDPAPDYTFDASTVKTNPITVQAAQPNYALEVNIANLGAYSKDSVDVTFYHIQPDGKTIDTIYIKEEGIANNKKATITLKNYGSKSVGKHKILAKIDEKNIIKEWPSPDGETNNELIVNNQSGFEYFVTDNVATAIYPADFAMINTKDHFLLKASTSSVPVMKADYVFQIDTTAYFNSPIKETGKVPSEGGLISYAPKLSLVANRVYYWRVSPDSISPLESFKWSQASFAYLPEEDEGWNQSHFFQFAQNEFTDLELSEETNRQFEFGKEYQNVKLRNKLWDLDDQPGYFYNNVRTFSMNAWDWFDEGISIIINNPKTMWHLLNAIGGSDGSYNPTGRSIRVYSYKTDTPENRKKAIDFIEKELKAGYFLTFYTVQKNINSKYYPEKWAADSLLYGKSLFSVLEKAGATQIRDLEKKGSVPYILQLVNGKEGVFSEQIADRIDDIVENTATYYNAKVRGNSLSRTIGSGTKFDQLKFKYDAPHNANEKGLINISGLTNNGLAFTIDSNLVANKSLDIDATNFQSIKLLNVTYDSLERTSPQLDFWRVSYTPYPDAAISFVKSEPNSTDAINQGETVKIHYEVQNVNYVPMDSLLVKYTYTNSDNQSIISYKKLKPLGIGEKINDIASFIIGAGNLSDVRIIIEINPNQNQPELHTFNNILTKQFGISKDKDNPLLDVYFDGIRIMDGDIVSPKPEILVTLTDDNTYLPIVDPNLFELKIDTGRNQIWEIPMSSPQVKFIPADQNTKAAQLLFYPQLKEGEYTLIVQGKDASGNKSGINPRSVTFKVIEKQSISNVLNYPNPFSTSTQFVFTLTGENVPDIMSISIMTLTGKVVKEITKDELGPLHIGINRTEYKWDGTDEYGSKLANGVYLYKINTRKNNGEEYDQYSVKKIDTLFKGGFGKMVILR